MPEAVALACRTCGLDFMLPADKVIFPCPACGTLHSRPRAAGNALADLRRAHQQRADCDFTNAAANYQRVLNNHPDEAEALWGLALCKYGVEYVQDERTGESLPVVHFLNRKPITEDPDFRLAVARASADVRPDYLRDGEYIARIQQNVLNAEQQEESWDVFLCYKSSVPGAADAHTREFGYAQEMYIALRDAGYRVFFAHMTLRHAAGANYEAQIFRALQTAKVMLVITAEPAYLSAPWVHSEWSRYLERIDNREDCRLIPLLYDRCDPYALPDEFLRRSLQGLPMGALTALDDLRHVLDERIHRAAPAKAATPVPSATPETQRTLLRINMALEDGDWQKAESLSAALVDTAPDCAEAHLSLLLARRQLADLEALSKCKGDFYEDKNWVRASRFAGVQLKREMEECVAKIEAARIAAEEKARREAEEAARKAAWYTEYRLWLATRPSERLRTLSVSCSHTVGLQEDGSVVAVGYNGSHQCDLSKWEGIIGIAAGHYHTLGLTESKAVIAIGDNANGQCDTSLFKRVDYVYRRSYRIAVTSIAAGANHSVAAFSDGFVKAIGSNSYNQCNVSSWGSIFSVAAGAYHTVGLKDDFTVIATGKNTDGQCNVSDWHDIISIFASEFTTIGLQKNGTVVATGSNTYGQCDVSSWSNIVSIAAGDYHTVGLHADGTVIATGENQYGECNISDWVDIVAIAAGNGITVGLKSDGSVVAVGYSNDGQCNVSDWQLKTVSRPTLPPTL